MAETVITVLGHRCFSGRRVVVVCSDDAYAYASYARTPLYVALADAYCDALLGLQRCVVRRADTRCMGASIILVCATVRPTTSTAW